MAKVELIMPKMGESVSEATIITWNKEIGEIIEVDEPIIDGSIETEDEKNECIEESKELANENKEPIITYSDIEGGWEGQGNIDGNPVFVDFENGDYTLQPSSPCIDAGTVDLNNDGYPDITNYYGLAPDIGAFEYGFCNTSMGDLNIDGLIDISDIIQMVNIIMGFIVATEDQQCRSDINQDGTTDIFDVIIMVNIILEG